ncbi:Aminoglycoside phosphotransferase [Penicillium angulare]|uniref:Aminoglycoside phosphotransferase n=1 Tax=Penicillium angulare TaxID=116970 RepID=A0A9W9KI26_9EURO|nr:Aminoglycoside phosphotransferase [Penicillium angulare]
MAPIKLDSLNDGPTGARKDPLSQQESTIQNFGVFRQLVPVAARSIGHDPESSLWKVINRPLSYFMNEIVQLGTLPRSKLPTAIYDKASSYFEALAELHISHLISQRNDAIDSREDCQRKFFARFLFRKIMRDRRQEFILHENGPFPLWCDDFRPENVLVNEDENIVGVIDWEFTYTAPVEFAYSPPWWLLIEKPEYWSEGIEDWCKNYSQCLEVFLQPVPTPRVIIGECEDEAIQSGHITESQRLSGPMRGSWESGNFWIVYAARNNFAFDWIYWMKIDQRAFGPTSSDPSDAWKERLDILAAEEKEHLDECVKLKLKEMETRDHLTWDPDDYTREYLQTWPLNG